MGRYWSPDETFFDLICDGEAIGAMLREIGGGRVADGNATETANAQKKIIRDCLSGTRDGGRPDWLPRYMTFPMQAYTKRCGIAAIENWQVIAAHHG